MKRHLVGSVVEANHLLAEVIAIRPEGLQEGSVDGAPSAESKVVGVGAEHISFPIHIGPIGQLEADPIVLTAPFCEIALSDGEDDYPGSTVLESGLAPLEH